MRLDLGCWGVCVGAFYGTEGGGGGVCVVDCGSRGSGFYGLDKGYC